MSTLKDSSVPLLIVTGGLHRGARVQLDGQALWVIGAGDADDICLADEGVKPRHAAIVLRDEEVVVRALEDGVLLNDRPVNECIALDHSRQSHITFADSSAAIQILAHADDAPDGPAPIKTGRDRSSTSTFLIGGVLFAVCMLFVVLSVAGSGSPTDTADGPTAEQRLQMIVDAAGLQDEVALSSRDGILTLTGTLALEPSRQLREQVAAASVTVEWRIKTVAELLESVGGVFRTNGYGAQLEYGGAGTVVVTNLDGSQPVIQRIASFARADVAGLRALRFAPAPEPEADALSPAVYDAPSGKRMTTIVDGDTAYIATEDGARYFVGSVLPSGHRVRRITAKGVQVDHENRISWLQF